MRIFTKVIVSITTIALTSLYLVPMDVHAAAAKPKVESVEKVKIIPLKKAPIKKAAIKKKIVRKKQTKVIKQYKIPSGSYAKTYEDGSLITCKNSSSYRWLSKCDVESNGHYMYKNKYYAVAMGNYFAKVGSKYKITLDTGKIIYVIKCDIKQDRHTTNRMLDRSGAMIEFIIDSDRAMHYYGESDNGYVLNGNFNNYKDFKGNIQKVEEEK